MVFEKKVFFFYIDFTCPTFETTKLHRVNCRHRISLARIDATSINTDTTEMLDGHFRANLMQEIPKNKHSLVQNTSKQ